MAKKFIDVMDTTFRDGFQSVFGGRVLMDDFFPAVEAAKKAGINHFEFGGGARFQSLYFYLREDAFEMMDNHWFLSFHILTACCIISSKCELSYC